MKIPSASSLTDISSAPTSTRLGAHKVVHFKMSHQQDAVERVEMKNCFRKLQQLVPTLSSAQAGPPVGEVELIQHVIDYIKSLEDQLDNHPIHYLLQQHKEQVEAGLEAGLDRLQLDGTAVTSSLVTSSSQFSSLSQLTPTTTSSVSNRRPLVDKQLQQNEPMDLQPRVLQHSL